MTLALSLVVKATIVLAVGLIVASVSRRASASIRHVMLVSTFGALIALPLFDTFGPAASFVVPIDMPMVRALASSPPAPTSASAPVAAPSSSVPWSGRGMDIPSLGTAIVSAWAFGVALVMASLLVALWRLSRLTGSALPWLDARPVAAAAAAEAGLQRSVDVVLHEDVAVPLTWGWRRPVIILPTEAREWTDAELRHALLHEMEHVYRGDWIAQLMARMVRAVYWFHPLVWIAMRRMCLEAERACDDAVIRTADRTAYADQLVSLAERLKNTPRYVVPAMSSRSDLSTRVRALLDERQARGRARRLAHVAVIAAMCVTVLSIGPVQAVERTPSVRLGPELHEAPWAGVVQKLFGSSNGQSDAAAAFGPFGLALIEAAEDADIDGIKGLIAAGADVNAAVDGDGSPLIVAARAGHMEAVQVLLDHGADVDMAVPGDGNPLIMAAREGHTEIVDLLLARGAGIDTVVDDDENALIQASGAGRLAVVRLLVGRGADVNARAWAVTATNPATGEWRTPLSMAVRGRHAAVVELLRSAGARE